MLNRKDAILSQKLKGKSEKSKEWRTRSKGLELLRNVFSSIAQIAAEILFVL